MKSYPPKLLFTTLQCFFSSIQSFAIAIAFERDPYQWKLGWNVRLLAVAYCVNLHYYFFQSFPYFETKEIKENETDARNNNIVIVRFQTTISSIKLSIYTFISDKLTELIVINFKSFH